MDKLLQNVSKIFESIIISNFFRYLENSSIFLQVKFSYLPYNDTIFVRIIGTIVLIRKVRRF